MTAESNYSVVITTTANEEQAEKLARAILDAKLAACIQIQTIKSFYLWKGDLAVDPECLLLIKTKHDLFEKLEAFIRQNHSYETPEIIELSIERGSAKYLNWIEETTA